MLQDEFWEFVYTVYNKLYKKRIGRAPTKQSLNSSASVAASVSSMGSTSPPDDEDEVGDRTWLDVPNYMTVLSYDINRLLEQFFAVHSPGIVSKSRK